MRKHFVVAVAAALSMGTLTAGATFADRETVVQPGENMQSISRRSYGDERHVWAIARANHLESPDLIYAGLKLILPDAAEDDSDPALYAQLATSAAPLSTGAQSGLAGNSASEPPGGPPLPGAPAAAGGVALPVLLGPGSPDSAPAPGALPEAVTLRPIQSGLATWYGPGFIGGVTYCGEVYDQWAYTAASNTLPCGTVVVVTNQNNGQSVRVRVTDRGAFGSSVVLDLSRAAFLSIAPANIGVVPVTVSLPAP